MCEFKTPSSYEEAINWQIFTLKVYQFRIKEDKEYLQNMYYNLLWYFERFKVQNKRSKKIKFYKWEISQLKKIYQYGTKI